MGSLARILLADDEEDLRRVLSKRLEAWGYTVIAAADGLEAVRLAATEQPQLILLDVMMPRLNGLEAVRQLKSAPATARIPIVLITAKGKSLAEDDVQALGVQAVLHKPYETDDLRRAVQAAVGAP